MSLGSLLVADHGKAVKKLNLFRGVIMESGAPSGYFSTRLTVTLFVLTRTPFIYLSILISEMVSLQWAYSNQATRLWLQLLDARLSKI